MGLQVSHFLDAQMLLQGTINGRVGTDSSCSRGQPSARKLKGLTLHELIGKIENRSKTGKELSRNVTIYFCHRYSGARLSEVGALFNLNDAAVSQASRRV